MKDLTPEQLAKANELCKKQAELLGNYPPLLPEHVRRALTQKERSAAWVLMRDIKQYALFCRSIYEHACLAGCCHSVVESTLFKLRDMDVIASELRARKYGPNEPCRIVLKDPETKRLRVDALFHEEERRRKQHGLLIWARKNPAKVEKWHAEREARRQKIIDRPLKMVAFISANIDENQRLTARRSRTWISAPHTESMFKKEALRERSG